MKLEKKKIVLITVIVIAILVIIGVAVAILVNNKSKEEEGIWYYDSEGNITNGTILLQIGERVNYSAIEGAKKTTYTSSSKKNGNSDQTFDTNDYEGDWAILGIENGRILLVATDNVKTNSNEEGYFYLSGQAGYQYGIEELNNISELYGNGKGAYKARSITIDDINKITGYNPEEEENELTGGIYAYGAEATFEGEGENQTKCTWTYNEKESSDTYDYSFTYLDGKSWKTLSQGQSVTLKCKDYYYIATNYLFRNDDSYTMLFFDENSSDGYWVASQCISNNYGFAYFDLYSVVKDTVGSSAIYVSNGDDAGTCEYGVRPVVYLESEVQLKIDDNTGVWNIE